MMYRVPRPSRSNGVKLHTIGDHEIGIEYTTGEPHVGKMAYDSQCGIMSRNISFRRSRPDYAAIVADAVRQVDAEDAMPKAGKPRSIDMANQRNAEEYDSDQTNFSDPEEVAGKALAYLEGLISPGDLEAVSAILQGSDAETAHEARNQATDRRRARRLAADAARHRPMSAAAEAEFLRMFPDANRLLLR